MYVALDTNILVYAEGLGDTRRCKAAIELIEQLPHNDVVLPAQVLGELSRVLAAKARRSASDIRTAILDWSDSYEVVDSSEDFQDGFTWRGVTVVNPFRT